MEAGSGRICAAYRLPTAHEFDFCASELKMLRYLKLWLAPQRLLHQISDAVAQPAQSSRFDLWSVERAVGASHGTTGWACKAAG